MNDGVSLREVLELPALRHVRVLAGTSGLDRRVRYVNVMEVPDILDWVKPDELLLTTAYPLRDDRSRLVELVPRLADRGLAGLAIKPARYIDAVPSIMLANANELNFPLLELPPETALADIINAVLSLILNAQASRLERAAAIHERFTRIVLNGGGLRELAGVLAELVNRPVAVVDRSGGMLASSSAFPRLDLNALLPRPAGPDELTWTRVHAEGRLLSFAAQPVIAGAEPEATILVLAEPNELGNDDLMAVERAAIVTALRLVQERMAAEVDERFRAVCLDELVTGHLTDESVIRERALAFGWDLSRPRAVLVAEIDSVGGRPFGELVGTPHERWNTRRLVEAARAALGTDAIVWERSAGLAALVAAQDEPSARAARLQDTARQRVDGASVSIGIGSVCADPLLLRESYSEAVRALHTIRRVGGPGQIAAFAELGLERLLLSCSDLELRAFVATKLGPLLEYEALHPGANLLATLQVFLARNRTLAHTARALYVHYNTVRYRLERIESLLGPVVDNPENCLQLELALRVQSLLNQHAR
jgi:PucR family transcriptional regulator, purine catabolism regulatory protein